MSHSATTDPAAARSETAGDRDAGRAALATGAGAFVAAMVLYALTIAPTISWGDSADLALRLVRDGDTTFIGTPRDYVLWRTVGQAASWLPFADAGLRANLFTAFWGAVTVGAVAAQVRLLSGSTVAALAAAAALGVAHSFWLLSVMAEVYTFQTALVALAFAFATAWWQSGRNAWLWAAALATGLCLSHRATGHVLAVALLPLVLMRLRALGWRGFGVAVLAYAAGASLYWSETLPRLLDGEPFLVALGLAVPQNPFVHTSPVREAVKFGAYLTFNFFGLGLPFGLAGLVDALRRRLLPMLPPVLWAAVIAGGGIASSIPDKFNVYVLVYPVFAIAVGLGFAWLLRRMQPRAGAVAALIAALILVPPAFYYGVARGTGMIGIDLVGARPAPGRDNNMYFLFPPKTGDRAPREYAEATLAAAPPNALLVADYTLWRPLLFVQAAEGMRPDVKLVFVERLFSEGVDNWIARQPCDRPVMLATDRPPHYYQLDRVKARFGLRPLGPAFLVTGRCGG